MNNQEMVGKMLPAVKRAFELRFTSRDKNVYNSASKSLVVLLFFNTADSVLQKLQVLMRKKRENVAAAVRKPSMNLLEAYAQWVTFIQILKYAII